MKIPSPLRWTFLGIALTIAEKGGKCKESDINDFEYYDQLRGVFNVKGDEWSADFIESKKTSKFVPPTLEEVSALFPDIAQDFIDFYQSKGWMVGKNKMKDWKAAARKWQRENQSKSITKNQKHNDKLGSKTTKSEFADLVNAVASLGSAGGNS